MKNLIEQSQKLLGETDLMIFMLPNGTLLVSLCKEKKNHFELFQPRLVFKGHNDKGQEFVKIRPWIPEMIVESTNTIIDKKNLVLFFPSEKFKLMYLENINGKATKIEQINLPKEEANTTNNIIEFANFRKHQKKSNLSLVVANTSGGGDAA